MSEIIKEIEDEFKKVEGEIESEYDKLTGQTPPTEVVIQPDVPPTSAVASTDHTIEQRSFGRASAETPMPTTVITTPKES